MSRFSIVLCELYNPYLHSSVDEEHELLDEVQEEWGHYLVHSKYKNFTNSVRNTEDVQQSVEEENIFDMIREYRHHIRMCVLPYPELCRHPFIKNYDTIIRKRNYIRPEMAETFYLETGECVAILKTWYIRWIQRAWKRVCKERQRIYLLRCRPIALHFRQVHGRWSPECRLLPGLKGLLVSTDRLSTYRLSSG